MVFPSPAQDSLEQALDLNEHLVRKPASTFFMRVQGSDMQGAGIFDGDLIVIDRSITARHGHVILAILHGEFLLKSFVQRGAVFELASHPAAHNKLSKSPAPIVVERNCGFFEIWGVVTHAIHALHPPNTSP